ncbi:MAG: competence protein ComEA [Solirubrobacteraceae bacterium]|nr:competence protein ComEA [Solirubrobacteraceae bacterium]
MEGVGPQAGSLHFFVLLDRCRVLAVTLPRALVTRMVALVLCAAFPAADAVAQGSTGVFSITPARRDIVGRPLMNLVPTQVGNTTRQDLQVQVFPVLLGQDVSGQFTFSEDPKDLLTAAKIVGAQPTAFDLAAGGRHTVQLTWALLPSGTRAAYVGVVFQSKAKPKPGQVVKTIQRLLSVNFLRLPGTYRSSGRFTRIRAIQAAPRVLQIIPRLKNTGEIVASPTHGTLRIRDSSGKVVLRQSWPGDVILPGYEREFPIEIKKILPAGEYGARVIASFGDSKKITIATTFKLVGPNQLPTPKVTIANFEAHGVIGGDSEATGLIKSIGTDVADTAVRVDLYKLLANGQQPVKPIKTQKLTFDKIKPGDTRDLKVVYPKLPTANYRVIATYRESPGSIQRVQADFTPKKAESFMDRVKRFWREHKTLILGLLALLILLLIVAYLLRRQRRLEQRLRAAEQGVPAVPAPAPDPAPPASVAAAAPAAVDINSASATELQAVPGIGPKAAEAIVAYRNEHGPFASVDGLAAVKGFGPQKIQQLASFLAV